MFDSKKIDDLAKRLSDALPNGVQHLRSDIQENFQNILQSTFNKLDLVTREEFDVQNKVLAKTRTKLEQLEKHLEKIEKQLLEKNKQPKPKKHK